MALASRIKWYLDINRKPYEVLARPHDPATATIPTERVARSVLLEDDEGYLIAVLPVDRRLDLDEVNASLHRHLGVAADGDAKGLFFDCRTGVVPALGSAYGLPTVIDDLLLACEDIYFDGGDGDELVHLPTADFLALNEGSRHAAISEVRALA